jgi:dihydrofolate reductase
MRSSSGQATRSGVNRIIVSNLVTLDGFIAGDNGDLNWFCADEEFMDYSRAFCRSIGAILFGRRTYQMMAAYWPTNEADENDPIVAERMNNLPKVVVSKTLSKPTWFNSRLISDRVLENIQELKDTADGDIAVFGSGELVSRLLPHGLIDELRLLVHPVILGRGRPEFSSVPSEVELNFTSARPFKSGVVQLVYEVRN